jgi:ketosteroid isomerase-like protein
VPPEEVVVSFNECINQRDLVGLGKLMTEDHVFIDSVGASEPGKGRCLEAWRGFFAQFPDYRNTFTQLIVRNDTVIAIGFSTCSTPVLDGPAIWSAKVSDDKVAAWRVHNDTPAMRAELQIHE